MARRATASNGTGPKRGRGRPRKDAAAAQAADAADTPATPAPTTMATTAQERWDKHFDGIKAARVELDKVTAEQKKIVGPANSRYRNRLKAFAKDGGNTKVMIRVLDDQLRDIDEVERDLRDYNAYAKLAALPIGTQLGMFPDGSSVASHVDSDRLAEQESFEESKMTDAEAYHAGETAGRSGKGLDTCPFSDAHPGLKAKWEEGWSDAQAAIAHSMGSASVHEAAHA